MQIWISKCTKSKDTIYTESPEAELENMDDNSSSPKEILLKVHGQLKSNNNITLAELLEMPNATMGKYI